MNKQDLETGMRVEGANGIIYIVILGDFTFLFKKVTEGLLLREDGYIELSYYDNNLNNIKDIKNSSDYNIDKIYNKPLMISNLLDVNYKGELLWERNTKLVFKDFIIENGINWDKFVLNCKVENQRWEGLNLYNKNEINYYKSNHTKSWIDKAFNWTYALCHNIDELIVLDDKWKKLVDSYEGEIVFE